MAIKGMQELVQQDRIVGVLHHVRPHHDHAASGIGRKIDDIGIGPLLPVVVPHREAERFMIAPGRRDRAVAG